MKLKTIAGLLGLLLGLAPAAWSQPLDLYENWGTVEIPPDPGQVDATAFLNHNGGIFEYYDTYGLALFNTFNTLNWTNLGLLYGSPGFNFACIPTGNGIARPGANFVNRISGSGSYSGVIECTSKLYVWATNIVNSGQIVMDSMSSLIQLKGQNIDLTRGLLSMPTSTTGMLDYYWGIGSASVGYPTNGQSELLYPADLLSGYTTIYNVTNRARQTVEYELYLYNPQVYINDSGVTGTNRTVQVLFLSDSSPGFTKTVQFSTTDIEVQWQWAAKSWPSGVYITNYLLLSDTFGSATNLSVVADGTAGVNTTYMPYNYTFAQSTAPFITGLGAAPSTPPSDLFGTNSTAQVTNQYSAYEGLFTDATALPSDIAGGNVTNLPGRIELFANNLTLNQARVGAVNYLSLIASNQFLGSTNATLFAPNMDFQLRTTNATMAVSNLVPSYLPHLTGPCELWSGRWTNTEAGVRTAYRVLFVQSSFSPYATPSIQTLKLNITNLYGAPTNSLTINDALSVSGELLLGAESVTLAANDASALTPYGELISSYPGVLWSTNIMPRARWLTNSGYISLQNQVYFTGAGCPLESLVNYGTIYNQGSFVQANTFVNSGEFYMGNGSFNLGQAASTVLDNGYLLAYYGEVNIGTRNLSARGANIISGGVINLLVTNLLDDGSLSNSVNSIQGFWTTGNGLNLPILPPQASLLATTVSNSAADYQLVVSQWAGQDKGCNPSGFKNNAALGRLVLEGGVGSAYEFTGTGVSNALYVDLLEFRDYIATNVDRYGNFSSAICDPNMKIYFGQAMANGVSIAEKLSMVNGGRFCWVSNYNTGFYSSTNIVYPDGSVHRLNTALVTSCDIDSNANTVPNCKDPAPVPIVTPSSLALSVALTNQPAPAAQVSWTAFAATMNTLYAAPALGSTNWQVVTNFFYPGQFPVRVTVIDPLRANAPRFYRVSSATP
jgi:hypothetical protein